MQECQSRCSEDYSIPIEEDFKLEFCFLARDGGAGEEEQKRWFYDSEQGVCEQFDYKGRKGNGNRFLTRQVKGIVIDHISNFCRCTKSYSMYRI